MDAQNLVTAGVAVTSMVVSAVVALFTIARQERQAQVAAEREHFARLWEKRQEGYLRVARWALEVRQSIKAARDHGDLAAVESVPLETLAQVFVYADFDVYRQGEFLRGQYERIVERLEELRDTLPTESRTKLLESIDEGAWRLIHTVRENALLPPDWREPIPLHPEADQPG